MSCCPLRRRNLRSDIHSRSGGSFPPLPVSPGRRLFGGSRRCDVIIVYERRSLSLTSRNMNLPNTVIALTLCCIGCGSIIRPLGDAATTFDPSIDSDAAINCRDHRCLAGTVCQQLSLPGFWPCVPLPTGCSAPAVGDCGTLDNHFFCNCPPCLASLCGSQACLVMSDPGDANAPLLQLGRKAPSLFGGGRSTAEGAH